MYLHAILTVLFIATGSAFAFVAGLLTSPQRRAVMARLVSRNRQPATSDDRLPATGAGHRA